ncbi:NUDIX domain-containing protein [bacterium]|nr:NUDIX domain-containing protein [bacterium]
MRSGKKRERAGTRRGAELERARADLRHGDALVDSREIVSLARLFREHRRESASADEAFPLVDERGRPRRGPAGEELSAPRWLAHLLGLRHASAHVVLVAPNGLLLLQKRSRTKDTAPGKLDTSVGGHVGAGRDALGCALAEMQEELGLAASALARPLVPLGEPFGSLDRCERTLDAEVVTAFVGELAPGALDRVRFADGEVARLVLAPLSECRRLLARSRRSLAAGARAVLPRALDFLERSGSMIPP